MPGTYLHGSDLLVGLMEATAFKPFGHSKSCDINNSAETKERVTKENSNSGKWTNKYVSKLSVSVSSDGFVFHGDAAETGYATLFAKWKTGEPVTVKYAVRGEEATDYYSGQFLITSLDLSGSADDDATYKISLENSGEVSHVTGAGA